MTTYDPLAWERAERNEARYRPPVRPSYTPPTPIGPACFCGSAGVHNGSCRLSTERQPAGRSPDLSWAPYRYARAA